MDLEAAVSETQHTLQQIFSKPKCTEKLLRRPPVRFIADIVRATIATLEFPNKYYAKEEFDFENKDAKVAFVEKLLYLVSVCRGEQVQVKASSIIAGKDVLETLQLLNSFGQIALDGNFHHDEAVAHCLSGGKIGSFPSFDADSFSNDDSIQSDLKKQIQNCTGDLTQTKDLLNSVITKPRCSTKLLEKPPFRFIQDVIIAIASAEDMDLTKVLSESERNSSNVKEKEAKMAFLRKLIDHVEKTLSLRLDMNPSRIVAGKDSEKTRKLLQLFVTLAKDENKHSQYYQNGHNDLPKLSFGESTNENHIDANVKECVGDYKEEAIEVTKEDPSRGVICIAQIDDDKSLGRSMKEVSPSDVKEISQGIGEKTDEALESKGVRPMTAQGRPRDDHVEEQEQLINTKLQIWKARPFLYHEVAPKLNESSSEESEQDTDEEEGQLTQMNEFGKMASPSKHSSKFKTYSTDNVSSTLQHFAKSACTMVPEIVAMNNILEELQLDQSIFIYQDGLKDLEVSMKQTKDTIFPLREELAKLDSDIKEFEEKISELSQ